MVFTLKMERHFRSIYLLPKGVNIKAHLLQLVFQALPATILLNVCTAHSALKLFLNLSISNMSNYKIAKRILEALDITLQNLCGKRSQMEEKAMTLSVIPKIKIPMESMLA